MELTDIKRVAIVGAGRMGAQIAGLFSRVGGCAVGLWDLNDDGPAKEQLFRRRF